MKLIILMFGFLNFSYAAKLIPEENCQAYRKTLKEYHTRLQNSCLMTKKEANLLKSLISSRPTQEKLELYNRLKNENKGIK